MDHQHCIDLGQSLKQLVGSRGRDGNGITVSATGHRSCLLGAVFVMSIYRLRLSIILAKVVVTIAG